MAEENTVQPVATIPLSVNPKQKILDQSLGEILQSNPQAQQMIMQAMGISQEKFAQMVDSAQQNNIMHMKISDLFKSGIVNQAVTKYQGKVPQAGEALVMSSVPMQQQVQLTPQQVQQLQNGNLSVQQLLEQSTSVEKKASFIDKLRNWFK